MNELEELKKLGWEVILSVSSPVERWGKWMVEIKFLESGRLLAVYGNTEEECFVDALNRAKQL